MIVAILSVALAAAQAQEPLKPLDISFPPLPPYRVFSEAPGLSPGPSAVVLPVVFLVPELAGAPESWNAGIESERQAFDAIFGACGIGLDVRRVAVFDTAVPLTSAFGARLVRQGPVSLPGALPLTGWLSEEDPEFPDRYAATLALLARKYAPIGLAIYYLDPLLGNTDDHMAYADYEDDQDDDYVVIGASEGHPPAAWAKVLAHEIGHIAFRESHPDRADNLMSTGADQEEHPATAITPEQCAKARAYIRSRWPESR